MLRITLNRVLSVNVFPPCLGSVGLPRVSEKTRRTSSIRVVATLVVHASSCRCADVWAVAMAYSLCGDGDVTIYVIVTLNENQITFTSVPGIFFVMSTEETRGPSTDFLFSC